MPSKKKTTSKNKNSNTNKNKNSNKNNINITIHHNKSSKRKSSGKSHKNNGGTNTVSYVQMPIPIPQPSILNRNPEYFSVPIKDQQSITQETEKNNIYHRNMYNSTLMNTENLVNKPISPIKNDVLNESVYDLYPNKTEVFIENPLNNNQNDYGNSDNVLNDMEPLYAEPVKARKERADKGKKRGSYKETINNLQQDKEYLRNISTNLASKIPIKTRLYKK